MRLSVFSFVLLSFAMPTQVLASIFGSSFDDPVSRANLCAPEIAAMIRADDPVLQSSDSTQTPSPPGGDKTKGDAEDCD